LLSYQFLTSIAASLSISYAHRSQIKLAADVKSFLTLPKDARDHSQLQKVLHGLEVVKSFSEYPLHMQEKLAKVAWYQE
jgi:hypothetical protein